MPRLVIFKDNLLVKLASLDREVMFIGRKAENDIVLAHTSVSRQHAKLTVKDGTVNVMDLNSLNGITVNGNRVTKAQLADGDTLGVGDFSLLFNTEDQPPQGLVAPESLKNSELLKESMDSTQVFAPKGDFAAIQDSYEALRALFLMVNRFSSMVDLTELLGNMMDCLIDIFGAERGFILLYTSKTGKFDLAVARGVTGSEVENTVSHTIALQVAKERQAILITDAEADHKYQHIDSIQRKQIRSIIATPITKKQRTMGVVYLDSTLSKKVFTSRDLSFLDAFTVHAASALDRALDRDRLVRETQTLKAITQVEAAQLHDLEGIVGTSPTMKATLDQVRDVASEDVTTILLGESGTGKELLARAIHKNSPRRDKPFVPVNCMALSEDVIESELFGHEKGAFSGALERRIGRFELADTGTIFLDEIGELSSKVQVKLLRVLQEKQIERVGGSKPIDVDVRVICATNADLERAVHTGRFRQDLYYRIVVFPIRIPPLRERREDVAPLVEHYLARFNARMTRKHTGVAPEAMARLEAYDWPGNVRELINVLERAFVIEKSPVITAASLPSDLAVLPAVPAPSSVLPTLPPDYEEAFAIFERAFFTEAWKRAGEDLASASLVTGVPAKTLVRKLSQYKLGPQDP